MGAHIKSRPENRDTRRVLDAIRQIVQVLHVSAAITRRKLGLSAAQLFILQKMGDGLPVSVNELARRTHTHQSSVSVVVQRLANKKLVRRTRSAADGRQLDLTLTAAGLKKLGAAPKASQDRLIEALEQMPRSSRAQLAGLLDQFVKRTGLAESPPALFFEDETHPRTTGRKRRTT